MFSSNSTELRAWVILHLGDVALFAVQHRSEICCPFWRERPGWNRSGPKRYVGSPLPSHTLCSLQALPFRAWRAERKTFRAWLRNDDLLRRRGTWDARISTLDREQAAVI